MNNRSLFVMGIVIISMLSVLIYFQVKDEQPPLTPEKKLELSQIAIDLLISLAEANIEEEKFDKAAIHYENASKFYKDQVAVHRGLFLDKLASDQQAARAHALAAVDMIIKAGDMLVESAKAWIRAGDNKKAAELYEQAARCYADGFADAINSGDEQKEVLLGQLYDNAVTQAADLGQ